MTARVRKCARVVTNQTGKFCHPVAQSLSIGQEFDPFALCRLGRLNSSTDELTEACRDWPQAHILHGSSVTAAGITFFGIGGGIPVTPFGAWSYDFTEEQATDLLARCSRGCVLISHSPPKGVLDTSSRGQSLGSVAVRTAILRLAPLLVVCGHIHACAGQHALLSRTPVVNAGPGGIEWEIKDRFAEAPCR